MNKTEQAAISAAELRTSQKTLRNAERPAGQRLMGAAGVLLSGLCLAACGQKDFQGDGFKSVKYGMSSQMLEAAGFKCETARDECQRSNSTEDTLFGMEANVSARLKRDKVVEITLGVGTTTEQLVDLYKDALGRPTVSEYGCFGGKCTSYHWKSSEGTMIDIVLIAGEKMSEFQAKFIGPRAHVTYHDKSSSDALIKWTEETKKKGINPKDL